MRPPDKQDFSTLYWRSVIAQLCASGMSDTDARLAVMQYRERMKGAGDTIYNDSTNESAMWAKKLFEPEAAMLTGKSLDVAESTKRRTGSADAASQSNGAKQVSLADIAQVKAMIESLSGETGPTKLSRKRRKSG